MPYDGPISFQTEAEAKAQFRAQKKRLAELLVERIERAKAKAAPEVNWEAVESFIGYGNIEAEVVFVGMEEGLKDPAFLEEDLKFRSTFERVMDVQEAHLGLYKGPNLFGERPRKQRTWWVMSDLMLHYDHNVPLDKGERAARRKKYRTTMLGNQLGDSLLVELLPYPHPKTSDWLYPNRYKTRKQYEAALIEPRLALLSAAIAEYDRKAVICYGREDWEYYKRLFPETTKWHELGRFSCAVWRGAKVTLTDHFVSPYFNSDQELDELATMALP
jgi:hypothetical protein